MRWLVPGKEVVAEMPCLDCGEQIRVVMRDGEVRVDPETVVGYQISPFVQWREGSGAFN